MTHRSTSGYDFVESTWATTDKAVTNLYRWSATNHTTAIDGPMPDYGFFDSIRYAIIQFVCGVIGTVLGAIVLFGMIAVIGSLLT